MHFQKIEKTLALNLFREIKENLGQMKSNLFQVITISSEKNEFHVAVSKNTYQCTYVLMHICALNILT